LTGTTIDQSGRRASVVGGGVLFLAAFARRLLIDITTDRYMRMPASPNVTPPPWKLSSTLASTPAA
jgi:hypothetical protein